MKGYNSKILKGNTVSGNQLKIPRAQSILNVALHHPYVRDVSCRINDLGDEIIFLKLIRLEVPDEPAFDLREEEKIAIVCHKEDIYIPEVYALREDFPLELPHSNARPFTRPVSLCVSDVSFADIRPMFNAFDFINSIRRWFNLNCVNQLHEINRPLEVYFAPTNVCCVLNLPDDLSNPYVRYKTKTNISSTLEFVEKSQANRYLICVPTEKVCANNFVHIPRCLGDLHSIKTVNSIPVSDYILVFLTNSVAGKAILPMSLLVIIDQISSDGKKESKGVFLINFQVSPSTVISKRKALSDNQFQAWYENLPIDVITLTEMISRKLNALANSVHDSFSKVAFVGTGTLGASVIDLFIREGCAESVAIVDFDLLMPHNLSRHILTTDRVMMPKVYSIKESYHGILGQRIIAVNENLLTLNQNDKKRVFDDTQLVADFSTSIAVERWLAMDARPYRRCTSFLNPRGDEIVLMMEDKSRHHRLDLLEMDYYRNLIIDSRFEHHLDQATTIRTNTFSCRGESVILNYENIRALSAIVSSQIRRNYLQDGSSLSVWHFDPNSGTVSNSLMDISEWSVKEVNGIKVYLSSYVENRIKEISDNNPSVETGGCLFGSYDRDYNNIYVFYMLEAPDDSVHTPCSFVRGANGLAQEYSRITKLTYHQVRCLGEWHSHPKMLNAPSETDKKQFAIQWSTQQSQDLPFVQAIFGKNGLYVNAIM